MRPALAPHALEVPGHKRSPHPHAAPPRSWISTLLPTIAFVLAGRPALAQGPPSTPPAGAEPKALEALPTLPPSEGERARGLSILEVPIAGNRRIPAEDVAGYLKNIRPGKTFTPEGLAEDVHELWN